MIADLGHTVSSLPLRRTVLLTLEMVRAARGQGADRVREGVDGDEYQWVWDISANTTAGRHYRELRFWAREVVAPEHCIMLSPHQVVGMVLGDGRTEWTVSDLTLLLLCSKQHIHDLLHGPLRAERGRGIKHVKRSTLENFFMDRLVR